MQKELNEARSITVQSQEVRFTNKKGQLVTIQQYQNLIRRQVDGKGHEIYLLNVRNIQFKEGVSKLQLSIISNGNRSYEYAFYLPTGET